MVVRYIRKGPKEYVPQGDVLPTVENGVVTNFNGGKLGVVAFPFASADNWEIGIKASTTYSSSQTIQRILVRGDYFILFIKSSTVVWDLQVGGTEYTVDDTHSILNFPFARIYKRNSKIEFWLSADGIEYQKMFDNIPLPSTPNGQLTFGGVSPRTWLGTLDLNDTYVKVNGEMWFGQQIFIPKTQIIHNTYDKIKDDVLLAGEPAFEKDTNSLKVGNGEDSYEELPYLVDNSDEWRKPKDWIDIRSGALSNSVYFLVGHSADYSQYPNFFVNATISNSGTYDVYVDGVKQATTAGGTATTLNWQTLALETGFDVTTPTSLRAHIVRVTPSVSTNTITGLTCHGSYTSPEHQTGLLWAHFTIANEFDASSLLGGNVVPAFNSKMLQAVTSANGVLIVSNLSASFFGATELVEVPTISSQVNSSNLNCWGAFYNCKKLKKVVFDNIVTRTNGNSTNMFAGCEELESIEGIKAFNLGNTSFDSCYNLKKLPVLSTVSPYANAAVILNKNKKLGPTYLDLSFLNTQKRLVASGVNSNYFIEGLKGLIVSNEAPFDGTSPQIDVSYTGLDRQALRQLFKSMPYNVGYTVVGSPTIVDGVVSGFDANNYLRVSRPTLGTNDFEFKTCFTTNTISNQRIITTVSGSATLSGFLINSSRLEVRFYNGTEVLSISSNTALVANTKYYAIMYRQGTTIGLKLSTDNQTWDNVTQTILATDSIVLSGDLGIGRSSQSTFSGSIDLKETYIKVNGVPWFTGKEAMTKTCNIVGCTGTADLTQEDKNIALDKGWELTVA